MSSSISDLEILTEMLCDDTIYDEEDKEFIMAMELNEVAQNLG